MQDIKLGARIPLIPITLGDAIDICNKNKRTMLGTVVYIHPKRRYFTAEFEVHGQKIKESFLLKQCSAT